MTTTLTSETFDEHIQATEGVVLVDFWAEWCGPCKVVAPILDEIDAEVTGLSVAKVNIDDYPALAQRYDVQSIPTLLTFSGGDLVHRQIGALPKAALVAELTPWLAS